MTSQNDIQLEPDHATIRRRLSVIAAVNDEELLAGNLRASPLIMEQGVSLVVERDHPNASAAYNAGLDRVSAEIAVFAHQDVFLPRGWEQRLLGSIAWLEEHHKSWGVLGVVGVADGDGVRGRVWSTGLLREVGEPVSEPTPVVSVDELLIVLNTSTNLRFDPRLPGYHLYGTDIVQTALQAGYGAFVVPAPVVHNSRPVRSLDRNYVAAYRYLQRKWTDRLPLPTCIVPVTKWGVPLVAKRSRMILRQAVRVEQRGTIRPNPEVLARHLKYEVGEQVHT